MSDIKERLAQKVAAAQSLVKVAGEGCCSHESAKTPEGLIDGTADVQVEGNTPAGVTIPGEKGMSVDGATSEDRGTDIGHTDDNVVKTTEGSETVDGNSEVDEFIASAEEFKKQASALKAFAEHILSIPDSAFSVGVPKTASAEVTEADVEAFIVKRANAGDPVCQGMLNYCAAFYKMAAGEEIPEAGVPAEAIAEGGDIEASLAQVQEQVAAAIQQEYPEIDAETANRIAAEATAQAVQDAMAGGEVKQGEAPSEEQIAAELVAETAAQLKQQAPDLSDEEAEALAVQAVSDTLSGKNPELAAATANEELPKEASADARLKVAEKPVVEKKAEAKAQPTAEKTNVTVEKKASAEGAAAETAAVETPVEPAAEEIAEAGNAAPDQEEVAEEVGNMVMGLAEEIKAQDPSISDEEAIEGAADAVADALNTVDVQQTVGATDESGAPVVDDAAAQEMVDELGKTAAANPLRDMLTPAVNSLLHLSPEAFAKRIGTI